MLVADSALGPILTAGDGMTVYLFMDDEQGDPTCIDACAGTWPPLTVVAGAELAAGDGVDPLLLGSVTLPSGEIQVTYNDWPLYFFSGDTAPGDAKGQGQGGVWFVVDPTGEPVDAP